GAFVGEQRLWMDQLRVLAPQRGRSGLRRRIAFNSSSNRILRIARAAARRAAGVRDIITLKPGDRIIRVVEEPRQRVITAKVESVLEVTPTGIVGATSLRERFEAESFPLRRWTIDGSPSYVVKLPENTAANPKDLGIEDRRQRAARGSSRRWLM